MGDETPKWYAIMARADQHGQPIPGTYIKVAEGSAEHARAGTKGWWGGRSLVSAANADKQLAKLNAGAGANAVVERGVMASVTPPKLKIGDYEFTVSDPREDMERAA